VKQNYKIFSIFQGVVLKRSFAHSSLIFLLFLLFSAACARKDSSSPQFDLGRRNEDTVFKITDLFFQKTFTLDQVKKTFASSGAEVKEHPGWLLLIKPHGGPISRVEAWPDTDDPKDLRTLLVEFETPIPVDLNALKRTLGPYRELSYGRIPHGSSPTEPEIEPMGPVPSSEIKLLLDFSANKPGYHGDSYVTLFTSGTASENPTRVQAIRLGREADAMEAYASYAGLYKATIKSRKESHVTTGTVVFHKNLPAKNKTCLPLGLDEDSLEDKNCIERPTNYSGIFLSQKEPFRSLIGVVKGRTGFAFCESPDRCEWDYLINVNRRGEGEFLLDLGAQATQIEFKDGKTIRFKRWERSCAMNSPHGCVSYAPQPDVVAEILFEKIQNNK